MREDSRPQIFEKPGSLGDAIRIPESFNPEVTGALQTPGGVGGVSRGSPQRGNPLPT